MLIDFIPISHNSSQSPVKTNSVSNFLSTLITPAQISYFSYIFPLANYVSPIQPSNAEAKTWNPFSSSPNPNLWTFVNLGMVPLTLPFLHSHCCANLLFTFFKYNILFCSHFTLLLSLLIYLLNIYFKINFDYVIPVYKSLYVFLLPHRITCKFSPDLIKRPSLI